MSWSISAKGPKPEVIAKVKAESTFANGAEDARAYILKGIEALKAENVDVAAYGHMHNGADYEVTSATISIKPATE